MHRAAPLKHHILTVKEIIKSYLPLPVQWEADVWGLNSTLLTSAVPHLKEKLNSWRLKAETASWRACTKLWGLDPGLKEEKQISYWFQERITYSVLLNMIARAIGLYYTTVAKQWHKIGSQDSPL